MKKQYVIAIISVIAVLAIALIIWGIITLINKETTIDADDFVSCRAYSAIGEEIIDVELSDEDLTRIKNIFGGSTLSSNMPDSDFTEDFKLYMTTSDKVEHEFLLATDGSGNVFWKTNGRYFTVSTAKQKLLSRFLEKYDFVFPEEK